MKKIYIAILPLMAALGGLGSCTSDDLGSLDGEGTVNFKVSIDSDVAVVTRATGEDLDELLDDFKLYVYSSKGLIRKYHAQSELPDGGLALISGDYVAYLWAGDSTAASYTHRYFAGEESFTISAGSSATVEIVGKIQNTVASVVFDSSVDDVITDATMNIGSSAGTLDFTYENADSLKGYYMLPEDAQLLWTLSGTMADGNTFSKTGTVDNAKSATEYQFTITYTSSDYGDIGGGTISVTVDETTIDVEENITLTAAPKILGSGFDIDETINASAQSFDDGLTVYVTAAAKLTSIALTCDNTTAWETATGVTGSSAVDFLTSSATTLAALKEGGLYMPDSTDEEGSGCGYNEENDEEIEKIIFTKTLLNALANGSYNVQLTATDTTGKSTSATLAIIISDTKVSTNDPAAIRQVSATLSGTILDTSAEGLGFQYRAEGESSWTSTTDEVTVDEATFTLTVTGLTPGQTYEYRAIADGSTGSTVTFTTNANFQMPDSDFETWVTETPYLIGDGTYWDSGNHGSATMSINVTTPDDTYKNSGSYSAKLSSQFVGVSLGSIKIGKFAAGNLFTGQYLATVGMSGAVLGFGQAFTQDDGPRPTALHGYVRYESGTVDYSCDYLSTGDSDIGSIYIAMLDSTTTTYSSYGTYPVIIDTTNDMLFSSTASNVMGYGSLDFTSSTSGEGMIEFEIPITYSQTGMPSNILVVAAASKYGDYFGGSTSSVMWVDDFELIYGTE